MKGRTYRYMTEDPLYCFGYGLSYTTFNIGQASASKTVIAADDASDSITLTIPVTNTGKRNGTEIVQVYVRRPEDLAGPRKSLRGYARVDVNAGATGEAVITLTPESFACFDETTNTMRPISGKYEVCYGNSSADADLKCIDVTVNP